jgi:hypothetical protein
VDEYLSLMFIAVEDGDVFFLEFHEKVLNERLDVELKGDGYCVLLDIEGDEAVV